MSSPYQQFKADDVLEKDGVVLDYGDYALRIARAGGANQKFIKVLEVKQKPYRRQIQNETLDENVARRMLAESYAEAIVLGWGTRASADADIEWGHFPGADGPLPFTKPNVVKVLFDLPDFFADVREQASKMALFRKDQIEVDAKN